MAPKKQFASELVGRVTACTYDIAFIDQNQRIKFDNPDDLFKLLNDSIVLSSGSHVFSLVCPR